MPTTSTRTTGPGLRIKGELAVTSLKRKIGEPLSPAIGDIVKVGSLRTRDLRVKKSGGESFWTAITSGTDVERHKMVQVGLSSTIVKQTLETFHVIPQGQLLQAVGLSSKTLGRRVDSLLGSRHSDAAIALIQVTDMADRVLGNRALAEQWLSHPAIALDGNRPLDMLTTNPGIAAVKDLLTRMEYGVYA